MCRPTNTQKVIPIEQGLKQAIEPTLNAAAAGTQKVIPIEQGLKHLCLNRKPGIELDSEGHSNRTRIETAFTEHNHAILPHKYSEGHSNRTRIETRKAQTV